MFLRTDCVFIISSIFLSLALESSGQQPAANFNKANSVQIVSYKPAKAKKGKDGSERVVLIQLFKGPKSGKDGKDGKVGPVLKVNISGFKTGDSSVLQTTVTQISENNRIDTFYVNPRYGQLKIIADGGDGGNGGQGEAGGGSPGSGGKGGTGGQVEVFFDSSALAFANCKCLVFSNEGGLGGWSGENYGKAAEPGSKGLPIYFKEQHGKIIIIK